MKKFLLLVGLLITVCAGLAFGHEFWLQPSRFFASVGEKINLQVLVGEGFVGERSEGKKNRISQYRHHTARGMTDLTPTITADTYGDVAVSLTPPGTHLFSFANTPKFLAMKADSFLLYLEEDGLDNVIAARKQQGETDKPSRELYERCVKTLVQVGTPITDNTFVKNTGMTLEIIPTQNPYNQHPGQIAEFRILFEDKPLSGALVRYWNRDAANRLNEEKHHSNVQGLIQFRLRAGSNMVSLVHMIPEKDTNAADWHSYWGSLTFGCR
ncbi:DUF4198 domain-containing protein [Spirosoma validum]|uniref:DUF4198 domain-containing protein n=1 Tax=Spirosoma validum TaxID=2771355 RepID=A0A927B575_9BACT|nr:DUF4198 domain-containing protein [Spirosoma validum]MBD2755476.1 DUF4198 domain-containing protein [Spirosoma validum]